jgi:hypothetical protein
VDPSTQLWIAMLAGAALIGGLWLLVLGLIRYRTTALVADTSTSPLDSLAAGEVRVSGLIEPAEVTLVSLLQSVTCVYYRSSVDSGGDRWPMDRGFSEERAVGFRVRDATGTMRVFPRGARFDAPVRYEAAVDGAGAAPAGLSIRTVGSTQPGDPSTSVMIAELLTVRRPASVGDYPGLTDRGGKRRYREARLEPGDEVTIVGRALPFGDLGDPTEADLANDDGVAADDPEIAADLAEATAAGALADTPAEAWGNAAIPGFGVGRPVTPPVLDPDADPLPLATAAEAERAVRTFDIAPQTLVLADSRDVPLRIAFGTPGAVVARGQTAFLMGLLGAILAIVAAMVLAIDLDGGFGR